MDGKEITHWFAFEEDFVTSFHSFITKKSALENIQLPEGRMLYRIAKEQLNTSLNHHHEIEKLILLADDIHFLKSQTGVPKTI